MEDQTEGLGLRLPDPAEEATTKSAQDTASVLASDAVQEVGSGPAEEPEPDFPDELPEETDGHRPATAEPRVDAALARLDELDGLPVQYLPFLSPPRSLTYASWSAWAARASFIFCSM